MIALAMLASVATGPVLHPLGVWRDWAAMKDYPVEAVIAREQGVTGFALTIDQNGLPQDCRVTHSSGSKRLDDQTCALMLLRARFRPPVDAHGQPTDATYRQSIRWHLPAGLPRREPMVDRSFDARATLVGGQVSGCVLTGAGASRFAKAAGDCGPFGNRDFLAFFLKDKFARTRATNVRLSIAFDGNAPPRLDRVPDAYVVLAKAALDVGADGMMTQCTSVTTLNALGHTLDLCDFLRSDPPRFTPQPVPRRATILLDLSGYYG